MSGSISRTPSKLSEMFFSFADTSFEKVYAKLQKDIKLVESLSNESESACNFQHRSPIKQRFKFTPFTYASGERLIYVNPNEKTMRVGSVEINDNDISREDAPAQTRTLHHWSHVSEHPLEKDESFFDFPDEAVTSEEIISYEDDPHNINSYKHLLSYESDSALDEVDEEEYDDRFEGEEASDIENAVLESSFSVDPHFYHAYFARTKPKICDETELQKVQDENIFQRLGAGFKPPLRMPDSCHPQTPKTQVLPNSNRLAAINTPMEGCSLSDSESANCDRALDLEDGIENMIKMASSQTTDSPKKSKNSKPKFDVYKHIRADGDSLIESNQNVHHCGICGNYAALTKETLEKHWRTHYKERPHKCPRCEKAFSSVYLLNSHLNTHADIKDFFCSLCSLSFASKSELSRHKRYKHTEDKPYKCTECDYASVESTKLKRHMRTHTGERPFKCHLCSYCCTDNFKLKRHVKTHTGEKPFSCPLCMFKFSQHASLKQHLLGHTGNKPKYQCEYCSVTCSRNSDLKQHVMKLHTSNKPQRCRLCGASFPDRHNLKQHMRRHRGEKLLQCEECHYKTNSHRHLQEHNRIHTGEKPFICSHCGQQFRLKQGLRAHSNRVHPELKWTRLSEEADKVETNYQTEENVAVFVCSLCQQQTGTKNTMRQHLRTVHEMTVEEIEIALPTCVQVQEGQNDQMSQDHLSTNGNEKNSDSTIMVTCTPDRVSASVVRSNENNAETIPVSSDSFIEAIFILSRDESERLSVMVEPEILCNQTLLQSLQSALEQNVIMKEIASLNYKRLHSADDDLKLPKELTENEEQFAVTGQETLNTTENGNNSENLTVEKVPEFSTIDTSVLQ